MCCGSTRGEGLRSERAATQVAPRVELLAEIDEYRTFLESREAEKLLHEALALAA